MLNLFMVKLRLARGGCKFKPIYFIVATDDRSPRDGKFIEKLGTFDPINKNNIHNKLNFDRYNYWLQVGAQPTKRVEFILKFLSKINK